MNDIFELQIEPNKYKSTNPIWNDLMLNDPWSIGYVSELIETKGWSSKEEWENFYYKSGEERRRSIIDGHFDILDDFQLPLHDKRTIYSLPWGLKNLNYKKGRTKSDFIKRAECLYNNAKNKGLELNIDDCYECVRFRTICETWNGIIIREKNTVATLQRNIPNIQLYKTDGGVDHGYAVDYEVKNGDHLLCGIQIKPQSYLGNTTYLIKAHNANNLKNAAYKEKFGVNVYNVISKENGTIVNLDVIKVISCLLDKE